MSRRKLLWLLTPTFLLLIVATLFAVIWQSSTVFRDFYQGELAHVLKTRAYLIEQQINQLPQDQFDTVCKKLGKDTQTRITLITQQGTVLADSERDPATMDNHGQRLEVLQALKDGYGLSIRFSQTLKKDMMYVTIVSGEQDGLIIRTSLAMTSIEGALDTFYQKLILGGFVIAMLATLVSFFVARRISRPLEIMKNSAEKFALGDLSTRLPIPEAEETAALAEAMNRMARQLDEKIQTEVKQRGELEAVLSSMTEGVLAVDLNKKVLRINQAAEKYWQLNSQQAVGSYLSEIVRSADLNHFTQNVLDSEEVIEEEIVLENGKRILQAHGTALMTSSGEKMGALMVFSDVTRLKRLETMRRDFVANVSHELKTPITSLKGFTETLLNGALDEPQDALKFLKIMQRQSNRLEAIIEDLMMLSRLEQDDKIRNDDLTYADISLVLESTQQACMQRAQEKNITIEYSKPQVSIKTKFNMQLLEQAMINLTMNAINYSSEKSKIQLSVQCVEEDVVLSVRDEGSGIAEDHLPRLFERFYRVDKGRSREVGGTGLGLAIVKHIARAHGGDVRVKSKLGHGSTFSISLPLVHA